MVEHADVDDERHASWPELFFDLVAVAGVSMLAHVLTSGPDWRAIGLYAVLFLSFWLTWTTFMIYGNVAGEGAHLLRLMLGMFGLGVMAASVPGVAHAVLDGGHGSGALRVYALAYVLTRVFGSQSWRRGVVVLDFPVVQHLPGTIPWLATVWMHGDGRVWWWAAGVALDLALILLVSGQRLLDRSQERLAEVAAGRGRRPVGRRDDAPAVVRGLSLERSHLGERLGLFVLIVLGESVVQVVQSASQAHYRGGLFVSGLFCFLLLASMFGLSVVHGHAGLPHLRPGRLPARAELGLHALVTPTIATVAVALAMVVAGGDEPLPAAMRWLLCAALAVYFGLGLVAFLLVRGPMWGIMAVWVATGIAVPLLLGLLADDVSGPHLVGYMALVALAHVLLEQRLQPRHDP